MRPTIQLHTIVVHSSNPNPSYLFYWSGLALMFSLFNYLCTPAPGRFLCCIAGLAVSEPITSVYLLLGRGLQYSVASHQSSVPLRVHSRGFLFESRCYNVYTFKCCLLLLLLCLFAVQMHVHACAMFTRMKVSLVILKAGSVHFLHFFVPLRTHFGTSTQPAILLIEMSFILY